MPETSIIIKSQDRYSANVKAMSKTTQAFKKDVESAEKGLKSLSATKVTLKMDLDVAKRELQELEKRFRATGDAADGEKLAAAQAKYDGIARNLKLVTRAAGETERAIAKMDNRAGTEGGVGKSIASFGVAFAAAGGAQMFSQLARDVGNTFVASAFGSNAGTVFSSILSQGASGAAIGSMIAPGIGTAVGAAVGAGVGALSGGLQIQKGKDDAFKSYVQSSVEEQLSDMEARRVSGSAIAAQRETDMISFSTLFGGRDIAEGYLASLVDMSNQTPFLYGDLTAMSKTLATYGYGANSILPVLQTIGDAGAALGMGVNDMSTVATALGRMKSSGKTSLEYLNMLNDRGINAVGMLADAKGIDQGAIYSMISKGQIAGGDAVEIILQALTEKFNGSMLEQSKTFSGLSSTVEGLNQELDNAMGEGYNAERTKGLAAQRDWLGDSDEMKEAYNAIGAWKADLENQKEAMIREAVDSAMESDDYKAAKDRNDAVAMGRIIAEAKIKGEAEYNASEGAQLLLESEKQLADSARKALGENEDYWDAGYERGKAFSIGLGEGIAENLAAAFTPPGGAASSHKLGVDRSARKRAMGVDRVPYDGFPALLHEGERVLTAAQAREADRGGAARITITGNEFVVRQESDIDAIASALLSKIELASMRF